MATTAWGEQMVSVRVDGMDDLYKALRQVNMTPLLRGVHRSIGQFVIDKAGPRLSNLRGEFPAYKKVRLNRSASTRQVQVIVGPKALGFAAEFGAYTHEVFGRYMWQDDFKRRVWPFWSGNQWTLGTGETSGYIVLPTIAEHRDEIFNLYLDMVDKATREAFPEGATR